MSKRDRQKPPSSVVRGQLAAERRRTRNLWITIGAVLLLVVAGVVGWGLLSSDKAETVAAPGGVTVGEGGPAGVVVEGEGPVLVEVYLDFLCPACKQFEATVSPTLDQLVAEQKIRLVWHPLGYLDRLSTPAGYSTRAASAAGCAADAGKIKAYGEVLFANQPPENGPGLTDDQLVDLGGPVGLNAPSFAQCVRDVKYRDWVDNVNDQAVARGVTSTPTVFVAGQRIEAPTPESITAAVDAAT